MLAVPAKVILFGEWAVTRGSPGVATPLQAALSLRLEASDRLEFRSESDPHATPDFFVFVQRIADALQLPARRYIFARQWQLREGLGSSSAVLALLLREKYGEHTPVQELWLHGRALLREFSSPQASGLDLAAQLWRHGVCLENNRVAPLDLQFPAELALFHAGSKADTARELAQRQPSDAQLDALAQSTRSWLKNRDWLTAINEHFATLHDMGVVPHELAVARAQWLQKGWIRALKTCGAGGGDCVLAWVPSETRDTWENDLRSRGWRRLPYAWGCLP